MYKEKDMPAREISRQTRQQDISRRAAFFQHGR
jgi:hypothetical protein